MTISQGMVFWKSFQVMMGSVPSEGSSFCPGPQVGEEPDKSSWVGFVETEPN